MSHVGYDGSNIVLEHPLRCLYLGVWEEKSKVCPDNCSTAEKVGKLPKKGRS